MSSRKFPLGILLLSGFIDYVGIAIVYPLLAYVLFDPTFHFLPLETSSATRGLWLGILIALHPLFQFLFAPILGSLSDGVGRRRLLLMSFWVGLAAYALAIVGIHYQSIALIALYRVFSGIACSNSSIVSAIVADISTPEKKAKHYGLLNMSFGAGFTLGPFISGLLAVSYGITAPFIAAFAMVALNLILVWWKLEETRPCNEKKQVRLFLAFSQIKQAAQMTQLRYIFLALLIFSLGWSFFTEFVPLFLISRYGFAPVQIGLYYGYTGAFYSLSAGFIIYPIIKRVGVQRTLFFGMFLSGVYLLFFLGIAEVNALWIYLPFSQLFLAFVFPAIASLISNRVDEARQGEVMGIYQSLIALALTITPFLSGSFVGSYPELTVIASGILMVSAGAITLLQRESTAPDTN